MDVINHYKNIPSCLKLMNYQSPKNPNTNEFITRDQYINIVQNDFLEKQKRIIISLGGLEGLYNLELKITHNVEYLTFRRYKFNELNCSKLLSQALLTYIYWKYRHPNCLVRDNANMIYIKKIKEYLYENSLYMNPYFAEECGSREYVKKN